MFLEGDAFFIITPTSFLLLTSIVFIFFTSKKVRHIDLMFLIWTVLLLMPFIVVPNYNYYGYGVFFLLSYFLIGFLAYSTLKIVDNKGNGKLLKKIYQGNFTYDYLIAFLLFFGVVAIFNLYESSIDISGLISLSTEIATERYTDEFQMTIPQLLSLILLYTIFGIKGYQSVAFVNWNPVFFLVILTPIALLYSVVYNSKATILYCFIMFLAFRYGFYFHFNAHTHIQREFKRIFLRFPVLIALVLFIFLSIGLARYGLVYLDKPGVIFNDLMLYTFGYHPGFTHWYEIYINQGQSLYLGTQTFQGFFELLGLNIADNYQIFPKNTYMGNTTNVDSALSDYIKDFGEIIVLMSPIILLFIVNMISKIFRNTYIEGAIASFMYANLLWFFVNPFFTYQTTALSFVLCLSYIFYKSHIIKIRAYND